MSRKHALCVALLAWGCSRSQPADKPAGVGPSALAPAVPTPPPPTPSPSQAAAPAAAGDANQTVSGTITLPAARKANVAKGDTIFIIARRAGGPPGPASMLAVKKIQAE